MPSALAWQIKPFEALTLHELYEILALRQRVFVVEQMAAYLDADGNDAAAHHVTAHAAHAAASAQALAASARLFAPGVRHAEASIGRVVCAAAFRGQELGRELMVRSITWLQTRHPGHAIRIGAQRYLENFYGSLGFVTQSAPYLEDGIWHVEMVRAADVPLVTP